MGYFEEIGRCRREKSREDGDRRRFAMSLRPKIQHREDLGHPPHLTLESNWGRLLSRHLSLRAGNDPGAWSSLVQ